jgi:O-antigen/teichoic acid export membrane protein
MKERLRAFWGSPGVRRSLLLAGAMVLAGGLDYALNVLAGRWLVPAEYGVFVAVAAILQVLVYLTNSIRNVVAFYTAEISAAAGSRGGVGAFLHRAWNWGWRWGLAGAAVGAVLSPVVARSLRLPSVWPLWAACPAVLLFFTRTVTDGALQGIQAFGGFGLVQVSQAFFRILIAAALIWLGYQATGAILALSIACVLSLAIALWLLRPHFRDRHQPVDRPVSWHYSAYTLLGLGVFAMLTNMDAIFVKRFFDPQVAGNYGPVVTLAKIGLFLPLALGIVLFPKVTKRAAAGRNPRPILLLALSGTLLPGLALSAMCFLFPGPFVRVLFTGAYRNPGIVLGLATLAATFYAGLNIWLNYALSLERPIFVYALVGVLLWQAIGMVVFGRDNLVSMTLTMVSAGIVGNLAGFATTWSFVPKPAVVGADVAS